MAYIHPLANALAQTPQVQRMQAEDKDRQLRRAEALRRNSATPRDQTEHEVESTDAITLQTQEDDHRAPRRRKRRSKGVSAGEGEAGGSGSRLDVVA